MRCILTSIETLEDESFIKIFYSMLSSYFKKLTINLDEWQNSITETNVIECTVQRSSDWKYLSLKYIRPFELRVSESY